MVRLQVENPYLQGRKQYVLNFGQTRKVGELVQELARKHTSNGAMMSIDVFVPPSRKITPNEYQMKVHELGLRNDHRIIVMPKHRPGVHTG